ncbi:MAG: LysM peptidoglycan-binding domain-containing protein [Chloroflexi bacterium]|nr:LysM peptidoglycan-binding domain-containing protein [Chloroflexota bacterium]
MTEVNLVKRLIVLGITLSLATGVIACTREKPFDLPTTGVAQVSTPVPAAITPGVSGAVTTLVPGPTETPSPTVTLVVPPPTLVVPTVPITSSTPSAPLAGTATTYTVQWGDWMRKIAEKHGVTVEALIVANPTINPNRIFPGQVLNIPAPGGAIPTPAAGATPIPPSGAPTTYTVQQGEWFYQIARKFNISVAQLQAANPGVNPNFLYPGQVLRIPGEGAPISPTPGSVMPTPGSGASSTYTVQPGDTLSSIAVKFKTTPMALQIANNLANPNAIYPGLVLIVPAQP